MALIQAKNLSVAFNKKPILSSLSFHIEAGECLGLIGASGAGKSMLALALMGLLPDGFSASGAVRLNGKPLDLNNDNAMRQHRGRDMALVFQEPALNPIRNIGTQLTEAIQFTKAPATATATATDAYNMASEALAQVGLSNVFDRLPDTLSGGERQRVMIAMAMLARPALLIADEPTTSLDTVTQKEILVLMQNLAKQNNTAILLISHDLALISAEVKRLLVMDKGAIIDAAKAPNCAKKLTHPISQTLLKAAQLPAAKPASKSASRPPKPPPLLTAENLEKSYPASAGAGWNFFGRTSKQNRILENISFQLNQGECLGLVGESGAGKSTLSRLLLGLEAPTKGSITLAGHPLIFGNIPRQQRRQLSAVFQDPFTAFNPRHSIRRIIAEPLTLMPTMPARPTQNASNYDAISPDAITHAVATALTQVGLDPTSMHRYIHEFSGGQRQRIAIARALITRPDAIIFDEAVSSLDSRSRHQVLELITQLMQAHQLSAIFISHDLAVIRAICHRVMVLDGGRIVEIGTTSDIFNKPNHAATKRLIKAIPNATIKNTKKDS